MCPKEITKTFLIRDFFNLPPVSTTTTPVVHLELWISPRIYKRNSPNGIKRALGKLIHVVNLKSKISWYWKISLHCPFNCIFLYDYNDLPTPPPPTFSDHRHCADCVYVLRHMSSGRAWMDYIQLGWEAVRGRLALRDQRWARSTWKLSAGLVALSSFLLHMWVVA